MLESKKKFIVIKLIVLEPMKVILEPNIFVSKENILDPIRLYWKQSGIILERKKNFIRIKECNTGTNEEFYRNQEKLYWNKEKLYWNQRKIIFVLNEN